MAARLLAITDLGKVSPSSSFDTSERFVLRGLRDNRPGEQRSDVRPASFCLRVQEPKYCTQ